MSTNASYIALFARAARRASVDNGDFGGLFRLDAAPLNAEFEPIIDETLVTRIVTPQRAHAGALAEWVARDELEHLQGASETTEVHAAAALHDILRRHPEARIISPDWRTQLPLLRGFLYASGGDPWSLTERPRHAFDASLVVPESVPPCAPPAGLGVLHPEARGAVVVAAALRRQGDIPWREQLERAAPQSARRQLCDSGHPALVAITRDDGALPIVPLATWPGAEWICLCARLDSKDRLEKWTSATAEDWAAWLADNEGQYVPDGPVIAIDMWGPPLLLPLGHPDAALHGVLPQAEVADSIGVLEMAGGAELVAARCRDGMAAVQGMPLPGGDGRHTWRRAELTASEWQDRADVPHTLAALTAEDTVQAWGEVEIPGEAVCHARLDAYTACVAEAGQDVAAALDAYREGSSERADEVDMWLEREAARAATAGGAEPPTRLTPEVST